MDADPLIPPLPRRLPHPARPRHQSLPSPPPPSHPLLPPPPLPTPSSLLLPFPAFLPPSLPAGPVRAMDPTLAATRRALTRRVEALSAMTALEDTSLPDDLAAAEADYDEPEEVGAGGGGGWKGRRESGRGSGGAGE